MKTVQKEFYGCAAKVQLTKKKFTLSVDHAGNEQDFTDAVETCLYKFLMALQERKLQDVVK